MGVQTQAAAAAEPPAYLAEPGGRAATQPGRGATPRAPAVTPPARSATAAPRAEAPPPAAAPSEEKRALDSTLAERQRDQSNVSERPRAAAPPEDARSNRESVMAPAIASRQAAPAALARSAAQRTLDIVSPDPAIRWRVSGSTVQRSTDAGATWQPQSPGVDAQFTAGASPQPSVCWLVGRGGTVLLSTDGQKLAARAVSTSGRSRRRQSVERFQCLGHDRGRPRPCDLRRRRYLGEDTLKRFRKGVVSAVSRGLPSRGHENRSVEGQEERTEDSAGRPATPAGSPTPAERAASRRPPNGERASNTS